MASKCKNFINTALPFSVLFLSLFQLYFQYSSLMTPRNKIDNEKDGRNSLISFMISGKRFDLNLRKIEENFEDNPLMKIDLLKNYTLKGLDKINEKRENQLDKRKLMLFYLMIYDTIFIICIYIFFFRGFKLGIVKIIFQAFKFYFTGKRLKQSNRDICLCETVKNFYEYLKDRDLGLFTPEGFQILEFLFNFVIIFDIIWLIIIKKNNNKKKGDYPELSGKIILSDEDRVDYKEKNEDNEDNDGKRIIVESNNQEKILSNENNDEENSNEDNNEDDENINENDDIKEDNIDEDNKDEDYKDDDNINNEDNNINNNDDNIDNNQDNNYIIETKNDIEEDVNNSLKKDDDEEENKIEKKNEGDEDESDDNKKEISEEEINEQETK